MSSKRAARNSQLLLDRREAILAKRALQDALELVNRVHSTLPPGGPADTHLDHAERKICTGITALRDADRSTGDIDVARKGAKK